MNILQLVLLGLNTIGELVANPLLGLGKSAEKVALIVATISSLAQKGEAGYEELKVFTAQIEMLAKSSDQAEVDSVWAQVDERLDRQHAELQALKDPQG